MEAADSVEAGREQRFYPVSTAWQCGNNRPSAKKSFELLHREPQQESHLIQNLMSRNRGAGSVDERSCFDDGFPNLFVENAEQLRNKHVAFLASFHSPQVMFEQLAVIYALPRMFVASFTLILPFFPTGTSERVEDEGEVATAASLARMLSGIPLSRGGPTSMVVFDIHALQVRVLCALCFVLCALCWYVCGPWTESDTRRGDACAYERQSRKSPSHRLTANQADAHGWCSPYGQAISIRSTGMTLCRMEI